MDGNFLAPVLLNVRFLSVSTYEALSRKREELQGVLDGIPADLDLLDATEEDLEKLGRLFSVLDGEGISGARGTVLAKILHRKRPKFVPLYDEQVRSVYQDADDPPDTGGSRPFVGGLLPTLRGGGSR